jgi:menaquinone-dependent protoporphyrinogen oxidase
MSDEVLRRLRDATRIHARTATEIARVLRGRSPVRLVAVDAIDELRSFRAAIIGCTVYDGVWMPGAHAFLAAHERQLEAMPVWLFATGPPEPLPEGATVDVPPELVGVIERIGPRDVALFAGSLQPHHLGAALRILARLSRASFAEHRDRAAVERWARHVAVESALAPSRGRKES